MSNRRLLASSALYGAADMLVLAVGGFLLLPLYTRTLSQSEFGMFVLVKANIEVLNCLLHLGLVSAVSRVYFDHRPNNAQYDYLSSIVTLFGVVLALALVLLSLFGDRLWLWLSPGVPAAPYLWFAVAISATGFVASLGTTWLRLEGRASAFALLQLGAASLLAIAAFVALRTLQLGLSGLLAAMLLAALLPAAALPLQFGSRFRPALRRAHIGESLHYALPIVVGLLAYFVLNRLSMLILQRHVSMEEVAVFGLSQQLAMLVTIAGAAFGKAMQPVVFAADRAQAPALLKQMSGTLMLALLATSSMLLIFAAEILAIVAPASYRHGLGTVLLLIVATFVYSLSLISDTALLYHRRPRASAAATLAGAALSVLLGLLLIPNWGMAGAAWAVSGAFFTRTLVGYALARSSGGHAYLGSLLLATAAAAVVALFAAWIARQGLGLAASLGIKSAAAAAVVGLLFLIHSGRLGFKPRTS